jgi:3-dehydroquinate synthase
MEIATNSIAITDNCPNIVTEIQLSRYSHTVLLSATEQSKNFETCLDILEQLANQNVQRDYVIYAIGGGIIQDITTLTASLYMRGLNWIFIPTTLMSMMDSCIGGKSSINLGKFKNLVGNFYPPSQIFIDTKFVGTLSNVDISSGISEGLKITYAKSNETFLSFCKSITNWRNSLDPTHLEHAISTSLQAKKWFIEIDEFDRKERKLLNFGHSFGHALESASDFRVPHGIGVLLGMKAAIYESGNTESCLDLLRYIDQELDFSKFESTDFSVSRDRFVSALKRDKKNSKSSQVLILPDFSGGLSVVERPLNEANLQNCWNSMLLSLEESGLSFEVL